MDEKKVYNAITRIDDDLIEKSVNGKLKRSASRITRIRVGAIAACFVLIVAAAIPIIDISNRNTEIPHDFSPGPEAYIPTTVGITGPSLDGEALVFVKGSSLSVSGSPQSEPPAFEFNVSGLIVKAKFIEILPDTFCRLGNNPEYKPSRFRLIRFQTLATVNVENFPNEFLYMMPELLVVDLEPYDFFYISVSQLGTENYVLHNITQSRMENPGVPVFHDMQDSPQYGNMIAFTGGILDEKLWKNKYWGYGFHYLDMPDSHLVVRRGSDESYTLSRIDLWLTDWYDRYRDLHCMTLPHGVSEDIDAALEYVKPFENGVFSEQIYNGNLIRYRRYINGCQTDETVEIDLETGEVKYSHVRFTPEEASSLENIALHIKERSAEYTGTPPKPPHFDPGDKPLRSLALFGWYVKKDGHIYGIIRTSWIFEATGINPEYPYVTYTFADDIYTVYDAAGSVCKTFERDQLIELIGADLRIARYQQGVAVEQPME